MLRLGPPTADPVQLRNPSGSAVTDEKLASWLQQHLNITPEPGELTGGAGGAGGAGGRAGKAGAGRQQAGRRPAALKPVTPEEFVERTMPLIVRGGPAHSRPAENRLAREMAPLLT